MSTQYVPGPLVKGENIEDDYRRATQPFGDLAEWLIRAIESEDGKINSLEEMARCRVIAEITGALAGIIESRESVARALALIEHADRR
jgi:hypothetical protein